MPISVQRRRCRGYPLVTRSVNSFTAVGEYSRHSGSARPGLWCYSELCRRSSDCDVFTKLTWFYSWPCIISCYCCCGHFLSVRVKFNNNYSDMISDWVKFSVSGIVSFVCYFKSMNYFTRRPWPTLWHSIRLLSRHYRPTEQAKIESGSGDWRPLLIWDRVGPFAKSATEGTEALTVSGRPGPLP